MPEPSRGAQEPGYRRFATAAIGFAGGAVVFVLLVFGVFMGFDLASLLAALFLLPIGLALVGMILWTVMNSEDLDSDATGEEEFADEMHEQVERRRSA